jgi:predicted nucleic acid-binding protein
MHRIRVYVDTSVFGGMHDEEFAELTNRFFQQVQEGRFLVLVSPLTLNELNGAPECVIDVLRQLTPEHVEPILLTEDVGELAEAYLKDRVLSRKYADDAVHVAAATVAGAELIVSWNFRHMVNYDRIRGFNAVNVRNGYRTITILSPREVIDVEQD